MSDITLKDVVETGVGLGLLKLGKAFKHGVTKAKEELEAAKEDLKAEKPAPSSSAATKDEKEVIETTGEPSSA